MHIRLFFAYDEKKSILHALFNELLLPLLADFGINYIMVLRVKNSVVPMAMFVIVCLLCACQNSKSEFVSIEGEALGTFVQVKCKTVDDASIISNIVSEVDGEAKRSMSIFDQTSLISRINQNQTDMLDAHIERNLEVARDMYELSGGAYDVTVKPLTEAWGFAGDVDEFVEPNIDSLLCFVGFDKIAVSDGRIIKTDARTQLDFNSLAKGYTVDLVAEALEERGIDSYMVNIGGEVRCAGTNARDEQWSIAIETPYEGNVAMDSFEKIIYVSDCAVATSGNYRRFYLTPDGRKVAHTIDPVSGRSVVSDLLSATVVAPTCIVADAAATMFMAMGSDGGALELARRCEEERGWLYYFIYADGDGYRIECSDKFRE